MKKLFGILILFCILASCKTSKASCEAYGNNNTKQTDKDRSDVQEMWAATRPIVQKSKKDYSRKKKHKKKFGSLD